MRTAATAQTPSPRQIAVRAHVVRAKRPPNFTIPWSGSIAGGRLPTLFVALAVDWFKMRSGESRRWRAPQLTQWFDARRSASLAKSAQEAHRGHFRHRPAPAALIERPPPTRAVN